jgi:hypothetical protein
MMLLNAPNTPYHVSCCSGCDRYLLERLELLESLVGIRKSLDEFEQGQGIPLEEEKPFANCVKSMTYRIEISPTAMADIEGILLIVLWFINNFFKVL